METLAASEPTRGTIDSSPDELSRSVHADAVRMARRDVARGLTGMAAIAAAGWLTPPFVWIVLVPAAFMAVIWTVRSAVQLAVVWRADPASWLATEQREAERERAEIAAFQERSAELPVATFTIAGIVVALTLIEWWIGIPRAIVVAALVKPWAREGEWWRLLSASFLHGSFGHLWGNMFALILLGRLVEMYDGRWRVALVYFVSVIGCSLASLWLTPATSLGASGGVIGLAGYLIVVAGRRHSEAPRWVRRRVGMTVLLPTLASGLIGFLFIDNAGHAGGLVAGALVGLLVVWLGNRPENLRFLATISRAAAAALVVAAAFTGVRLVAQRAWPVRGLDHVPIAVNDLRAAATRFLQLGFTLKPGRPHDNGISNQHAKFSDGTELELITAPEATDDLTRKYREHLAQGDGPAFLALFAPERTKEIERDEHELPPYMFFGPRNASPTDRPEYFQHANTAESLVAVWLAGSDLSKERAVFQLLGATLTEEVRDVPTPTHVTVAKFAEGQVVMLPADRQVVPGRPIVGVSVRVKSLDFILHLNPAGMSLLSRKNRIVSAFVPPERANGLWIEFWAPGSLQ